MPCGTKKHKPGACVPETVFVLEELPEFEEGDKAEEEEAQPRVLSLKPLKTLDSQTHKARENQAQGCINHPRPWTPNQFKVPGLPKS